MLRAFQASLVFVLLLATPALAVDWLPFSDADDGFAVEFPGTPTLTHNDDIKAPDGSTLPMANYTVVVDNEMVFAVSITDARKLPIADPAVAVDGCVAGVTLNHTKISDVVVQVDGQMGRAVAVRDKDGITVTDEIFFVRGRLYQILTARPGTKGDEVLPLIDHFTQSFHFAGGAIS
jgi:hypothetical protein